MLRRAMFVIICLSLLFVSGCWDQLILEDLAMIFAAGFDVVEDNPDLISLTATNPAFSPEAEKSTAKRTTQGYSITQTLMNMQLQRPRTLVMGKVRVLLFSEEIAETTKLINIMRELDQRRDMNPLAWMAMVRGSTAQNVMHLEPNEDSRIAIFLEDILVRAYEQGRLPRVTVARFWSDYSKVGITSTMPVIEIIEGEDDGVLVVGLACLNEQGVVAGIINDAELMQYMILSGRIHRGSFYTKINYVEQRNRTIKGHIKKTSRDVKVRLVDGSPEIDITFRLDLDILDIDMTFDDLLDENIFRGLETALARDFQGGMMALLAKTQDWKVDPVGLGYHSRIQHPHWFRGRNWVEDYAKAKINVEVAVRIRRIGTQINPRY